MTQNWSNTVLVAFSALPKILKELDSAFDFRLKTSYGSVHLKNGVSTESLVKEMLEINETKRKLVRLHYTVLSALDKLTAADRAVLEARFIEGKTFQQAADDEKVSLRTVFRRLDRARDAFLYALKHEGLDEKTYERDYLPLPYIRAIEERLARDAYFTVV